MSDDPRVTVPAEYVDALLDCTCGHAQHAHDRNGKCTVGQRFAAMPVCPCDSFVPGIPIEVHRAPPVPVSDEAEAWAEWSADTFEYDGTIAHQAFIAGFRAARQAGKDEQP